MHSQQKYDPIKTSHDREGMLKKRPVIIMASNSWQSTYSLPNIIYPSSLHSLRKSAVISGRHQTFREMMSEKPFQKKPMPMTCQ